MIKDLGRGVRDHALSMLCLYRQDRYEYDNIQSHLQNSPRAYDWQKIRSDKLSHQCIHHHRSLKKEYIKNQSKQKAKKEFFSFLGARPSLPMELLPHSRPGVPGRGRCPHHGAAASKCAQVLGPLVGGLALVSPISGLGGEAGVVSYVGIWEFESTYLAALGVCCERKSLILLYTRAPIVRFGIGWVRFHQVVG